MSWQTTEDTIRQRWVVQIVGNTTPALPTIYENQERDKPQIGHWARLAIIPGESRQVSIGDTSIRFRRHGIIMVSLFEEIGRGTKNLNILADQVVVAFRSLIISSIHYRTPTIVRVGRTANWWQLNVDCPFFSDEIV